MLATAAYYHLPPRVLPSIQAVEGGYPGAAHVNTDGSTDLGVMQINTVWVQTIASHISWQAAAVRARLTDDPCFNIAAAGAILDLYRVQERGDLMAAIGDYHSHTKLLNAAYRGAVIARASALFGSPP
jgi:hypothetical protein